MSTLVVVILLVVVGDLLSFALFGNSRSSVRKSTCQNNLKELAIAVQLYWNDCDAAVPSSAL